MDSMYLNHFNNIIRFKTFGLMTQNPVNCTLYSRLHILKTKSPFIWLDRMAV